MKAVMVHSPGEFGIGYVPVPDTPERGMLLKVMACGLCGSDLRTLRSGHHRVNLPWIIGHEISGEVVDLGSKYDGPWKETDMLAVGPLAYCGKCDFCLDGTYELCEGYLEIAQEWPGGFAEYVAIPEECVRLGTIQRVPDGLNPSLASVSEPISSCVYAQEKGQVGLGDVVVIIGTGPIGCIHIMVAHARGAETVIVADILDGRLELAKAFGPDEVINAAETDLVDEVRNLTSGKGADVIVTATPAAVSQVQAVEMARKGGRVLLFGGLPKDQSKPGVDMNIVHYNALHLIGTTIFAPRHQRIAIQLLASGRLRAEKLVTELPLTDFRKGVAMAMEGKALKVVFVP
jgi:L-iditol 2-dehydrogenase